MKNKSIIFEDFLNSLDENSSKYRKIFQKTEIYNTLLSKILKNV